MEVLEALSTARAIRYLKPEPLPDAVLEKLVWGATRASNPGNSQGWEFVVVRDRATKERLGAAVRERMGAGIRSMPREGPMQRRMLDGAAHLLEHFAEVPAWIVICGRKVYPPQAPSEAMVWSTVYPAAQNLTLAARGLGLGTTFTTFQAAAEAEFRAELGIPDDVLMAVSVALGFPDREFGPVLRKPVSEVTRARHIRTPPWSSRGETKLTPLGPRPAASGSAKTSTGGTSASRARARVLARQALKSRSSNRWPSIFGSGGRRAERRSAWPFSMSRVRTLIRAPPVLERMMLWRGSSCSAFSSISADRRRSAGSPVTRNSAL